MADKIIIGYAGGSWDLLNHGHILLLERAKKQCDFLIVGCSTDTLIKKYKKCNPTVPYKYRVELLTKLRMIDMVVKQTKLFDFEQFKKLKCDKFFIGTDWRGKEDKVIGLKLLKENNNLVYLPYTKNCSSSLLKEDIIKHSYNILKAQLRRQDGK